MSRHPVAIALAVAALAAGAFTWLYYPGVLYTDSYFRWDVARALLHGGPRSAYLSIAPSLWMALTHAITGGYAGYTLLQSFLYFFSTLLVLQRCAAFGAPALLLVAAVLAAVPVVGGYSVFHEGGIGAVIGIDFVLVLLLGPAPRATLPWRALHALALFAAVFTTIGFRQNALTLLPGIVWLAARGVGDRRLVALRWAAIAGAVAALFVLPRALGYRDEDASAVGPAWEIAQTLKGLDDPRYATYLDYAGSTRRALSGELDDNIWDGLFAPGALSSGALRRPDVAARVRRDYLRLVREEPAAFARTKRRILEHVFGFGRPLDFYEFDENRLGRMPEFGWAPSARRHRAFVRVQAFMAGAGWLRRPWIVFLATLALVTACGALRRAAAAAAGDVATARRRLARTAFGFALLYYAAFAVTTQGYEFRYFFPALQLSSLAIAAAVAGLLRGAGRPHADRPESTG